MGRTVNLTAASLGLIAGSVGFIGCGGSGDNSSGALALMQPGHDCLTCHAFTVAGTVFNASGGGASGATVMVGGLTLTSNAAGNFYTASPVPFPAKVEISLGGGAKTMTSPAPDGRCNNCHDGVSQPRLTVP
jgi:hypothetical protein